MSHPLILNRLINTPLLLEEVKLDIITSNVSLKLITEQPIEKLNISEQDSPAYLMNNYITVKNNTAVIPVHGSLVSHNATGDSGVRSYLSIGNDIRQVISENVKTSVFSIKSYGGEADSNFGLCNYINSLKEKGIRTIALIDGPACSGGYTIAAACDEIWCTPSSTLGSMGVMAALVDLSGKDKKDGVEYKIIRSKSEKCLITGHEGFSKTLLDSVTAKIMKLDEEMNLLLTSCRKKLSIETILDLKGNTVLGREALTIGLADKLIDSFDIALEELTSVSANIIVQKPLRNSKMNLEEENTKLKAENASIKADTSKIIKAEVEKETTRCLEIISAGKKFGISDEAISKRIQKGSSVEDSVEFFESLAEEKSKLNPSPQGSNLAGTVNKTTETKTTNGTWWDNYLASKEEETV